MGATIENYTPIVQTGETVPIAQVVQTNRFLYETTCWYSIGYFFNFHLLGYTKQVGYNIIRIIVTFCHLTKFTLSQDDATVEGTSVFPNVSLRLCTMFTHHRWCS